MIIRESISQVKTSVKAVNADVHLSNKAVYSRLLTQSNLIIQRESDALRLANMRDYLQTLKCWKMEEAPAIDSCCGIKNKATVFRSVKKLPDMYSDSQGPIFGSITGIDYTSDITYTTPSSILRALSDTNSKWDKTVYSFFRDGHFYLVSSRIRAVNIEGAYVLDIDPVNKCNCGDGDSTCVRFLDSKWIIPRKLEDPIIRATTNDLLNSFRKIPDQVVIDKNPNT